MNPKDRVGLTKPPAHVFPPRVLFEACVAMFEGALKYGPYNWREKPIRASGYINATMRHLGAWLEGEDIDPDSRLSHVTKAITTLVVLRDAMLAGKWIDDRPTPSPSGWMKEMQEHVEWLLAKHAPEQTRAQSRGANGRMRSPCRAPSPRRRRPA